MGQRSQHRSSPDLPPAADEQGRPATDTAVPAWYPDPSGRHAHRWFNGSTWTADVADDGRRGFDPEITPDDVDAAPSGRVGALTSLTFGVTALTIAWMPFVVVLGVAAALAAIVLGILVLSRARDGRRPGQPGQPGQRGQRLAGAGIACGVGALALSGVGMASSRELLDDLRAARDPGAHTVDILGCEVDADGRARATGEITNRADGARSYAITVTFGDGVREFADRTARVAALAPGSTERFEVATSAGGTRAADLSCAVERVSAPTVMTAGP